MAAMRTAYVVAAANSQDLAAARAEGHEILFEGDSYAVAKFFEELTEGSTYAVLDAVPSDRGERVRAALLLCEGLAARIEATLLSVRGLFPVLVHNQEMLEGKEDYDFEMDATSTLEQCIYDLIPPLRIALRRLAFSPDRS